MTLFLMAGASADSATGSYRAAPTAACLRHDPHYTRYATYTRKPFSIQVFGPASRLFKFPPERGATLVISYYEPRGPHFGSEVGIYFFDTGSRARVVYNRFQAPYLRANHKPLNLFELHRNVVIAWDGDRPSTHRKLILGCLRVA